MSNNFDKRIVISISNLIDFTSIILAFAGITISICAIIQSYKIYNLTSQAYYEINVISNLESENLIDYYSEKVEAKLAISIEPKIEEPLGGTIANSFVVSVNKYNNDGTFVYRTYRLSEDIQNQVKNKKFTFRISKSPFTITPNKKYIYNFLIIQQGNSEIDVNAIVIDLEKVNQNNLNEEIIDLENFIQKEYLIDLWARGDNLKKKDLEIIFKVYEDLSEKMSNN